MRQTTDFLIPNMYASSQNHSSSVSDPGFSPDPDQAFLLSPDPDQPKIRIRSGKIRIHEKKPTKTVVSTSKKFVYVIFTVALSTLYFLVRFLQKRVAGAAHF